MTTPIKSDQIAYASSPYLSAYLQKRRMAEASGDAKALRPDRLVKGNVVAYEVQPQSTPGTVHQNGQTGSKRNGLSGSAAGSEKMEDRPIDRLHQFEIERGLEDVNDEGDPNPYDDSADDEPKARPNPDKQ